MPWKSKQFPAGPGPDPNGLVRKAVGKEDSAAGLVGKAPAVVPRPRPGYPRLDGIKAVSRMPLDP